MKTSRPQPGSDLEAGPSRPMVDAVAMDERVRRLLETQELRKLVGEDPMFRDAIAHIGAASRSEATILVGGETGTGKELFARAVHYCGKRSAFPFVPVNCGALPDMLLEDELFGHERGAYTDARAQRTGLITHAEKGTIFLDEVDALSLRAQVALLRVLEDKRFRALGSSIERQADVRIIAATNADLRKRINEGTFRSDLYFRLCILSIHLPALRDRKVDILPLAEHFLKKHNRAAQSRHFADDAREAMLSCNWPGNVRQLENAIIRGCELCEGERLHAEDLGLDRAKPAADPSSASCLSGVQAAVPSFGAAKRELIAHFERDYLTRVIAKYRGNVSRAAREAQKERREFGRLLKKHQIDPRQFNPAGQASSLLPKS